MGSEWVAIAGIGSTFLVSVLGILFPVVLENQKARRARIAVQYDTIREKAENLFLSLSKWRNPDYLKTESMDGIARIELRANYEAWALAVFSELGQGQRETVEEIRHRLGYGSLTGVDERGQANVMKFIDTVVQLSCSGLTSLNNKSEAIGGGLRPKLR